MTVQRWPTELWDQVRGMLDAGETYARITAATGVRREALRSKVLKETGSNRGHPRKPWPDDRWLALDALIAEGLSCREMALRLGVTKGAVIGVINRTIGSGWSDIWPNGVARHSTFDERMAQLERLVPDGGCRYPIGDPGKSEYRCCGEPIVELNPETRRRLCLKHHRLCWEKAPKRHAGGPGMAGERLQVVQGGRGENRTSGA